MKDVIAVIPARFGSKSVPHKNITDVNVVKFRQLPIVWKFPILNIFCAIISPLIPVRTQTKFFRWSRELMLIGSAKKPFS
jgi:hypothetical protein